VTLDSFLSLPFSWEYISNTPISDMQKVFFFYCNETEEMLGFSFCYAASLVSISTEIHSINLIGEEIHSINLIGETFVALTTTLQVVLWSGPLQLLLCILMNYCLLSVKPSKQRTNLANLAENPSR